MAPSDATAISVAQNTAFAAGPSGELGEQVPFPAMVVMVPDGSTFRIRPQDSSRYTLPSGPTAMLLTVSTCASVAGPPSPEKPGVPFPATTWMSPSGVILRTRLTGPPPEAQAW